VLCRLVCGVTPWALCSGASTRRTGSLYSLWFVSRNACLPPASLANPALQAAYIAYSAFGLLGVHYGLGAHVDDVPVDDRPRALFFKWAGQVAYVVVAALVKLIVGFLLLRLCAGKRWQRIVLWTLVVVSSIYALFYVFIVVFQCLPVQYYWHRYDPDHPVAGTCNDSHLATIPTYISFVISVVSDWVLALLPVSIVWNAKMDRRSKISVSCVLALGSMYVDSLSFLPPLVPWARGPNSWIPRMRS
jgi:hypothetical protein